MCLRDFEVIRKRGLSMSWLLLFFLIHLPFIICFKCSVLPLVWICYYIHESSSLIIYLFINLLTPPAGLPVCMTLCTPGVSCQRWPFRWCTNISTLSSSSSSPWSSSTISWSLIILSNLSRQTINFLKLNLLQSQFHQSRNCRIN